MVTKEQMRTFYAVDVKDKIMFYPLYKEVKKLINFENKEIIDIGCGDGDALLALTPKSSNGVGIDINKARINAAKQKTKKYDIKNVKFDVADAEKLKFKSKSFDVILCIEVLEFALNKTKILSEIKRITKNNSRIIIIVPNYYNPLRVLTRMNTDAFMKPKEIKKLIYESNLKIIKAFNIYPKTINFIPKNIPFGTYLLYICTN
jgi:ubiquinone/menaquinone biosynthesis C-methylase UbiE